MGKKLDFYQIVLEKALERIQFPTKHFYQFIVDYDEPEILQITFRRLCKNFGEPLPTGEGQFNLDVEEMWVYHIVHERYGNIPMNEAEAIDHFVQLIFRGVTEFEIHELMECFLVDRLRFRNPHEDGEYLGHRLSQREITHYKDPNWRNHIMWEACRFMALEKAPDLRSPIHKVVDLLDRPFKALDWAIERRARAVDSYYQSWAYVARLWYKDRHYSRIAKSLLSLIQDLTRVLILG